VVCKTNSRPVEPGTPFSSVKQPHRRSTPSIAWSDPSRPQVLPPGLAASRSALSRCYRYPSQIMMEWVAVLVDHGREAVRVAGQNSGGEGVIQTPRALVPAILMFVAKLVLPGGILRPFRGWNSTLFEPGSTWVGEIRLVMMERRLRWCTTPTPFVGSIGRHCGISTCVGGR
jgi:hypothetical protein